MFDECCDATGNARFGLVKPGQYNIEIKLPDGRHQRRSIWVRPGENHVETVVAPAVAELADVGFQVKGAPEGWVAVIRPGRILYEMQGVTKDVAQEAFRLAAHKLSVKTRFVERGEA